MKKLKVLGLILLIPMFLSANIDSVFQRSEKQELKLINDSIFSIQSDSLVFVDLYDAYLYNSLVRVSKNQSKIEYYLIVSILLNLLLLSFLYWLNRKLSS